MKPLAWILVLFLAGPAFADSAACPLAGVWKSDAPRTLADLAANKGASPTSMNFISADFFGRLYHEWTCTGLRFWFEGQARGEFAPFELRRSDELGVVVNLQEGLEDPLHLIFEGNCYKIRFGQRPYHEYFCRVESP